MKFGDYLRQKREENGWTQPEAAAKADIEQSYLSKLETGKSYPSESIFGQLMQAYSLDLNDLTEKVYSAELDKLREIGEVRAVILKRQHSQTRYMRSWLIAGLVMLMLGSGILGLAYSTAEPDRFTYFYRSEGVIRSDESPMIFEILNAGGSDGGMKTLAQRINYDFVEHHSERGETYIVQVEGGYRKYSLHDVKPDYGPSLIAWHFSWGFMLIVGGLTCFYISRRWR